jgi:ribosome biogenesis GTPase
MIKKKEGNIKTGNVVRSTGSWYAVRTEDGQIHHCKLKGKFRIKGIRTTNPIAVGDKVDFVIQEGEESGVIQKIYERENYVIRKATNLSKAAHIIASNLDQAVLIASLAQPRTSSGFIDRFLVTSEAYHIPAVIVFNKIDLYDDELKTLLEEYIKVYTDAGYTCLVTSAREKINVDGFKEMLQNKTSLLSGHSGVGKSALINAIDPTLNLKEGEISIMHEKGKHTTTFAEMFPLAFGGFIIDTPGIKEFGLVGFDSHELGQRFPEIRDRMAGCRFNNCIHVNEPGCAILKAVEDGEIARFRYINYLKMLDDIKTDELPK